MTGVQTCALPICRSRTLGEASEPIDASGGLPDGAQFSGAEGLRKALLAHSDQIAVTITEKLLTFALGRGLESSDASAVRAIVHSAAPLNYPFTSGLILGVVKSAPFQMRMSSARAATEQNKVVSNVPHE